MVEMTMFNVQRAITTKVGKPELRFMCSVRLLIVLYIYVKFPENISNSFQLTERTRYYMVEMAMFNIKRAITPKVDKPELWFMCSTCPLTVLYIYVKFGENISDSIRIMEWI